MHLSVPIIHAPETEPGGERGAFVFRQPADRFLNRLQTGTHIFRLSLLGPQRQRQAQVPRVFKFGFHDSSRSNVLSCMKPGLLAAAVTLALFAQTGPSFEVASIRENPGPWHVLEGYSPSGPRLTLEGWSIRALVQEAYGLKPYQVINNQSITLFYNIAAKAEGEASLTRDQFRPLLQRLLADRFALKVHRETREIPVYVMVIGKNGPKLKESDPDEPDKYHVGVNGRNQSVELQQGTMGQLAESIPGAVLADRPVIDQTGLTGKYDIRLEATPYFRINNSPQPDDLSVFEAIQQQLGLKLEPQKEPIEVLVVDRIEKPTEN